jgi:O-antigen/teichoic acid export membrane protein
MALAHGVAAVVGLVAPGGPDIAVKPLGEVWPAHWQIGRRLLATTAVEWLQNQLLTLIAGAVLGAVVVGALRATENLVGITRLLFRSLQSAVPTGAARAAARGGRPLRAYTIGAIAGTGLGTLAIVGLILTAPETWLWLLYGDRLAGWGWLLYWQAAICLLIVPGLPLASALVALERTRPLILTQLGAVAVTVLLGVAAAQTFGVVGILTLTIATLAARQAALATAFWRASAPPRP